MEKKQLIILGSGPAGLAAAIYAKRAELDVLVIEKNFVSGGQVLNTYEVDNYPGLPGINGFDMGMKFREHADKLEVPFVSDEITKIEKIEDGYRLIGGADTYEATSLIVATGATHRKLGLAKEEELVGRGVSYCATCDGAFFRGRDTVVVGGGDVALEDAAFLARYCNKVYVIHRRDEFRGAMILQKQLKALENVEILYSHTVEEICGEEQVEKLLLTNKKDGTGKELPVGGVFIAVGMNPETGWVPDFVEKDEKGYIKASEEGITNVQGIFVAGDARTKHLRQIITAVSDGANAAISAATYVGQAKMKY